MPIASYPKHVRPAILVLAFQGARTHEALQLTWDNICFARRTLHFNRTKNGEPRTVPMHQCVLASLLTLHQEHGEPRAGHVFLNRVDKPYADTRDYKLPGGNPSKRSHAAACQTAEVIDFTVHDWRDAWASQCLTDGIDLRTIQRLGGWKSLRMLERYMDVHDEHIAAAVNKLT